MWDNARILNLAAGFLIGIVALVVAAAGSWMLLRSEHFPVREVVLVQPVQKTTSAEIEAAVQERLKGNFFAVSPDEVRLGLERLPWVRRASVRRVWPDRLEVALEEHRALARWGDDALVNSFGERFEARTDQALPLFIGPAGTEREVALGFARFSIAAAPLRAPIERVVLTPRFAWQLSLADGLEIMLGREADAAEKRLRRFVRVYEATLRKIPHAHSYVDLRYPNGFALRVPADVMPGAKG
jgi:cell division protein FtsQ